MKTSATKYLATMTMALFFLILSLSVYGCATNGRLQSDPHIVPADEGLIADFEVLSPPIIIKKLYACASSVGVQGFIPPGPSGQGPIIDIFANGIKIGEGEGLSPSGQRFKVEHDLVEGDLITATQTFDGVTSLPSYEVMVRSHRDDYPNTDDLPRPYISPTPLYECGKATGVWNIVPGAHLRIFAQLPASSAPPVIVGEDPGSGAAQAVRIEPMFMETERITAQYQICDDLSPLSSEEIVLSAPASIHAPTVERPHEGADIAVVHNIVNGAEVDINSVIARVGGDSSAGGTSAFWIDPRAGARDRYRANQRLCGAPGHWSPEVPTVPCAELPPAIIRQPTSGDDTIHVTDFVPGSRITIFVDDEEAGDGGGAEIRLIQPLGFGQVVRVTQMLDGCVSHWMYEVVTGCPEPSQFIPDPSDGGMYGVGRQDYDLPPIIMHEGTRSVSVRIAASVRYPAVPGTSDLIRRPTRLPLVVLLHGDYGPNTNGSNTCTIFDPDLREVLHHEGYNYVLDSLARGGFIAVSINANELSCGNDTINLKKDLIFLHLQQWKQWNNPRLPDPVFGGIFHGRVDLSRLGLIGHSMGGEATVVAAQARLDPAITIRAAVAVAPTSVTDRDVGVLLEDIPLLMLTGTNDFVYLEEFPQKIYRRARKLTSDDWFKSMVTIDRGIHDYFNRAVTVDIDPPNHLIDISRPSQEAILRAFARSFFELTLHSREDLRPIFSRSSKVSGLENDLLSILYESARPPACK